LPSRIVPVPVCHDGRMRNDAGTDPAVPAPPSYPRVSGLLSPEAMQRFAHAANTGVGVDLGMILMDALIDHVCQTPAEMDALALTYRQRVDEVLSTVEAEEARRILTAGVTPTHG